MKVIELMGYGDDRLYTESVWINESMSKKDNIDFRSFGDDKNPDNAHRYLKSLGFKKVHTDSLTFGGNL